MHASSSKDLTDLEASLGYSFKNKSLLKEAVTHKSYAHEQNKQAILFNERMEFLGDSVLELIISEYLYAAYTEYTEADLSKIKAYTVQESTLSETSKELNIGAYLLLGKGEEMTGGREKPSLLANAFESILAAMYLDGGYEIARDFVLGQLTDKMNEIPANKTIFDFKTRLQEVAQAQFSALPKYITHSEQGPEHQKIFEVKVLIKNNHYGTGSGRTKKAASQKAAEEALILIADNIQKQISNNNI